MTTELISDLKEIKEDLKSKKSILIVTSPGNFKRKYPDEIMALSKSTNFEIVTVSGYPTVKNILDIVYKIRNKNFDLILSLGGGSPIDISKILSVILSNQDNFALDTIDDFRFINSQIITSKIYHISIPTTSGSGAESTKFSTIWDYEKKIKLSAENPQMLPDKVYLYTKFLGSLNFENTLYPGLDAICHSFDSLFNKNKNDKSEIYALESLEIFKSSFNDLLQDPKNLNLRGKIHQASNLAGKSINITKTSITHALSYPLTLNYKVPHGLACAVFIIPILKIFENELNNILKNYDLSDIIKLIKDIDLETRLLKYTKVIDQKIYLHQNLNLRMENFVEKINYDDINKILKLVI